MRTSPAVCAPRCVRMRRGLGAPASLQGIGVSGQTHKEHRRTDSAFGGGVPSCTPDASAGTLWP